MSETPEEHIETRGTPQQRWKVGDLACDCRYTHQRIVELDDDGTATMENGHRVDIWECLDDPEHTWPHPTDADPAPRSTP